MPPDPPRSPSAPPAFATPEAYAACLEDVAFWAPYVAEILRRHGLPGESPAVGRVGSFPTFLTGCYVVKLFGERLDGATCHRAERAVLRLLRDHPSIPAPTLLAEGGLFDDASAGWPWPYLVMTRIDGTCWWNAALDRAEQAAVARRLGEAIRELHALPVPTDPFWARDWIGEHRATCVSRQRRWRLLPPHLVDQIEEYLLPPDADRRLPGSDRWAMTNLPPERTSAGWHRQRPGSQLRRPHAPAGDLRTARRGSPAGRPARRSPSAA